MSVKKNLLDKTRFMKTLGPKGLKPVELWFLSLYFDKSKKTFLNAPEAVHEMYPHKPTSYCGAMGHRFRSRLSQHIGQWLEEDGLSEIRIKEKLFKMLDVKTTKFQKIKGLVDKNDLPDGVRVVVTAMTNGKFGLDYETVVAIQADAPEIQARILEDLIKMKGLNAPEKIEIGGTDEFIQRLNEARSRRMEYREEPIDVDFTERTEDVSNDRELLAFLE